MQTPDAPRRRALVLAVLALLVAATPAAAKTTTALHVEASHAPQAVFGSDGREHVEYDLITTNAFSADATLGALRVRGDGRTLLTLAGDPLAASTRKLFTDETTATVTPASSVFTQVDVVLPRSYGRTPPRRFTNRMTVSPTRSRSPERHRPPGRR